MSRIIVGIDGSEQSVAALRWAARRSERTGDEVVAVFAWSFSNQGHPPGGVPLNPEFTDDDAQRLLAEAVETAGLTAEVRRHTIHDYAAEAITAYARPDDTIIVGARGLGGFKGLLLGSVSQRILETSPCPVAVIRSDDRGARNGEVVVGVDGSERSMRALRWAASEAASLGARVRIVHAWQWPILTEVPVTEVFEALEQNAEDVVAKAATDPSLVGLTVAAEAVRANPAQALLAHDDDAAMFVVADRGYGALKRLVLGSTSRQLTHHATAPVIVVRPSG